MITTCRFSDFVTALVHALGYFLTPTNPSHELGWCKTAVLVMMQQNCRVTEALDLSYVSSPLSMCFSVVGEKMSLSKLKLYVIYPVHQKPFFMHFPFYPNFQYFRLNPLSLNLFLSIQFQISKISIKSPESLRFSN